MSVRNSIKPCRVCGDWVCKRCRWVRSQANRHPAIQPSCHRCGGTDGFFQDVRHTNQSTREEHELLANEKGWR